MKLTLKEKKQEAENIWSFIFSKPEGLTFQAGQFLQLFVPHENPDDRGIERYFTVAASPTEDFLMITTKIVQGSSTFKKALLSSLIGATFEAVEPDGSFVLPEKITTCILIAGGIGITPYRSMAKFCADTNFEIPLKLIYANKTSEETAYFDFFQSLEKQNPNLRVFYTMTEPEKSKTKWEGKVGRIDEALLKEAAGELDKNLYYLSGPKQMVLSYKELLLRMGIGENLLRLDYFPGYETEKII